MVWYKSKNTSYQYPKQTKNIYTYIVLYIRRRKKKKHQKLKVGKMLYKFYRYTCTILISYVEKVKKEKEKCKMTSRLLF